MTRVFLLSPAHSGGKRAAMLTRPGANFELARQVQIGAATLGDVFTFCSGLYFRGKLTYARQFAAPPLGVPGVLLITPSRGLLRPETLVGPKGTGGVRVRAGGFPRATFHWLRSDAVAKNSRK